MEAAVLEFAPAAEGNDCRLAFLHGLSALVAM